WKALIARHPDLARYRPYTLFAVGHDYVEPDHRLAPADELCLFPPVSGGRSASGAAASGEASGEMSDDRAEPVPPARRAVDIYAVVERPLSPDAIATQVDDPGAG